MTRTSLLISATAALGLLIAIPFATVFGQSGDDDKAFETQAVTLSAAFTYQGRLTDATKLADGSYDMRFILFDAASGGAQQGVTVTLDNVAVVAGYFTATLDFGATPFNGDARWLEIAIQPGATPLTPGAFTVLNPRQPLTAVPYALHALSGGGLDLPASEAVASASGTPGLAIAQTGGGDGVVISRAPATPTPGDALDVTNTGAGAAIRVTGDIALDIDGAIYVTDVHDDAPAFVHVVTAGNLCEDAEATFINHPFTNGNDQAMLLVTFRGAPGSALQQPLTSFGVAYDQAGSGFDCAGDNQWVIYSLDAAVDIVAGMQFNVLVVNR